MVKRNETSASCYFCLDISKYKWAGLYIKAVQMRKFLTVSAADSGLPLAFYFLQ